MPRLFVAVPLPPVTVPGLGTVSGGGGALPHITLKFLGEVAAGRVAPLAPALERALRGAGSFGLSLRGLGAFPNEERPRVLYVNVEQGREELSALARRVEEGLAGLGFPPEPRPFVAHLTVKRLRPGRSVEEARELLERHRGTRLLATWISRVELVESLLQPGGAVHTPLAAFPLAPAPA